MTAYVLVIVLAASGHHQSFAVGYPDQGSCLVAAERQSWPRKFGRSGRWSFCLMTGTLCPSNQERS